MNTTILSRIFLQIVLITLNAVFVCAETAVISINDNKLAKLAAEGDERAVRLAKLTDQPVRFLTTIRIAITLSCLLGSAFAANHFSGMLSEWLSEFKMTVSGSVLESLSIILITILLSYFTLLFGELVPKRVATRKAESVALGMSGLVGVIASVFSPFVIFLTFSTNIVLRLMGIDPHEELEEVSEEEIRMMVDVGSEIGTIEHEEKEIIQNVFEFNDLTADEIATRRQNITMLDLKDSMDEWKEIIYSTRHKLYPICEESADHIIGILDAKEYFRLEEKSRGLVMAHAVRQPYFVPDKVKADTLFRNMKKEKQSLAVVLDEYGGMTGIVTLNDLVEQIVGELGVDAAAEEKKPIEVLGDNLWKIQGNAQLEEVSEMVGIVLTNEVYGTFNGFVFQALGKVPKDGDRIDIEASGLHIRATRVERHQIVDAVVEVTCKTEVEEME